MHRIQDILIVVVILLAVVTVMETYVRPSEENQFPPTITTCDALLKRSLNLAFNPTAGDLADKASACYAYLDAHGR